MAKKNKVIQHLEFRKFKEVIRHFRGHTKVKALGEDWGVVRVLYPKGTYDEYYIFIAIDTKKKCEINIERAMILVKDCTANERRHIDEMLVVEQPGVQATPKKEDPTPSEVEVPAVNEAEDTESDNGYIVFNSLEEALGYFESQAGDVSDESWGIYRLDEEEPEYPDSYILLIIDVEEGEELDLSRAVVPKNKCSEEDKALVESFPSIKYGDPDDGDGDGESVAPPEEGETEENQTGEKPLPNYNGNTLH
jgi:hypothetical protein